VDSISKALLTVGLVFVAAGLLWHVSGGKIPLGHLPGDLRFETRSTKIYLPLTSGLLLSAFLSLLSYLFRK
jgi:hypothetical protein